MRKIAIFGGSFDPIHKAHINVAKLALQLCNLNKIIFVLSTRPPHKIKQHANILDRINMLNIAIAKFKKFELSLYEANQNKTVYSYQTLDYFQRQYTHDKIYLIVGSDCFLNFHSWNNISHIKEYYNLIVISRPGYPLSYSDNNNYIFLNKTMYNISSTAIRQAIKQSKNIKAVISYLNKGVYNYILKNNLYNILK
ncbi:MAG: nicotinate (nicotinamide) nucleotide adenylyltransferase [Endomicrobium sp.]|jgi:nicotinate-nucleotide adenylyltransferase|nr:nicotinate (nicotinamide) nucleotide adenylyltransferase [Endomicrobium sp.]